MSVLDRLRALFVEEDDPPSADRIAEVRSDAAERLEAAEEALRRHREARADAVLEGDEAAEAHEAREAELEREVERLRAVRDRLGERLDDARIREMRERAAELADEIDGLPDAIDEARAALRRRRDALDDLLTEAARLRSRLRRKTGDEVYLPADLIARVRDVADDLPGHHRQAVENLTPPDESAEVDGDGRRVVVNARTGGKRFVGRWSRRELAESGFRPERDVVEEVEAT